MRRKPYHQDLTGPPTLWGQAPVRDLMLRGPTTCCCALDWKLLEMQGRPLAGRDNGLSTQGIMGGLSNPATSCRLPLSSIVSVQLGVACRLCRSVPFEVAVASQLLQW